MRFRGSFFSGLDPWSDFDALFRNVAAPLRGFGQFPPVNLHQTDKELIVEAEVPGVKENELNVEVKGDGVTISGERKTDKEIKEENFYSREFGYGKFSRFISFPVSVKEKEAKAELKNGTLTIHIPKAETAKPKVIRIKPISK